MFVAAPERLRIKHVVSAGVPGTDRVLKASRIIGAEGRSVTFARPPEFPQRIAQGWLERYVPAMADDEYKRLVTWLKLKRWTQTDLETRVHPLRQAGLS